MRLGDAAPVAAQRPQYQQSARLRRTCTSTTSTVLWASSPRAAGGARARSVYCPRPRRTARGIPAQLQPLPLEVNELKEGFFEDRSTRFCARSSTACPLRLPRQRETAGLRRVASAARASAGAALRESSAASVSLDYRAFAGADSRPGRRAGVVYCTDTPTAARPSAGARKTPHPRGTFAEADEGLAVRRRTRPRRWPGAWAGRRARAGSC